MPANGYVTADSLLALAGKRNYRDVSIANPFQNEAGPLLKFRIRSLNEAEWSTVSSGNYDLQRGALSAEGLRTSDVRLVALSLVDGEGNLLLTGQAAIKQLLQMPASIIEPLVRECRDFNNLRAAEDDSKNLPAESDLVTSSLGSPDDQAA